MEAPRILHIASHGFFLRPTSRAPRPAPAWRDRAQNPLLRSGLALAGANLARGAHDDGILTALEASSLNLWGTKLVTLSACDTGVGEVRNGEGVYGLRRAFVLAGAETLVMSLWPVSDYIARETMVGVLRRPAGGPRPRRRAAAGEARDAEAPRPPASVLLGELHPVRRVGRPRRRALKDFRRRDARSPTSLGRPRSRLRESASRLPMIGFRDAVVRCGRRSLRGGGRSATAPDAGARRGAGRRSRFPASSRRAPTACRFRAPSCRSSALTRSATTDANGRYTLQVPRSVVRGDRIQLKVDALGLPPKVIDVVGQRAALTRGRRADARLHRAGDGRIARGRRRGREGGAGRRHHARADRRRAATPRPRR